MKLRRARVCKAVVSLPGEEAMPWLVYGLTGYGHWQLWRKFATWREAMNAAIAAR
jgi:hypothetical protein